MEVKRFDGKKLWRNIITIIAIIVVVFLVSYVSYVGWLLFPVPPDINALQGRMYGNVEKETYLLIEGNSITVSMQEEEYSIPTSEYVDGILTLTDRVEPEDSTAQEEVSETTYTFIFLQGDRLFFKEQNIYMELIWLSE